ncbi:hypothetical protein B0A55_00468 [Friedmanniomyces simplex]|uniref:Uncharacterized protein n=1 Tax=Friedmanniomyces simplex TaxID=329884 RepID=A0A4U0Y3D8_9PEZI|nr:hypothetical protein B0A55_00468 [Friedmanniomyces simplex]
MEDLPTPSSPTTAHPPGAIMAVHPPPRPPSMSMARSKRSSSRITDGASSRYSDDDAKTAVKVAVRFLERWVRRAAHPTKKGTEVRYEYRLPAGYREDEFQRQHRRKWESEAGVMKEGRAREELGMILEVLRQGARGS